MWLVHLKWKWCIMIGQRLSGTFSQVNRKIFTVCLTANSMECRSIQELKKAIDGGEFGGWDFTRITSHARQTTQWKHLQTVMVFSWNFRNIPHILHKTVMETCVCASVCGSVCVQIVGVCTSASCQGVCMLSDWWRVRSEVKVEGHYLQPARAAPASAFSPRSLPVPHPSSSPGVLPSRHTSPSSSAEGRTMCTDDAHVTRTEACMLRLRTRVPEALSLADLRPFASSSASFELFSRVGFREVHSFFGWWYAIYSSKQTCSFYSYFVGFSHFLILENKCNWNVSMRLVLSWGKQHFIIFKSGNDELMVYCFIKIAFVLIHLLVSLFVSSFASSQDQSLMNLPVSNWLAVCGRPSDCVPCTPKLRSASRLLHWEKRRAWESKGSAQR